MRSLDEIVRLIPFLLDVRALVELNKLLLAQGQIDRQCLFCSKRF